MHLKEVPYPLRDLNSFYLLNKATLREEFTFNLYHSFISIHVNKLGLLQIINPFNVT